MSVSLSPVFNGYQSFLSNGLPNNGGFIYTYLAGSSTPVATYTTSAGDIANANPIVLTTGGYPTQEIWLTDGVAVKFVITDANSNILHTYDNISSINSVGNAVNIKYNQGSTGAATISQQAKNQQVVSVTEFYANGVSGALVDPTGITDSTLGIISAIAGGIAYVPTGTYLISNVSILNSINLYYGPGNFKYLSVSYPAGDIVSALTLSVPSVFASIQLAINFLNAKYIHNTASAIIKVADGTYSGLPTLSPQHPQGEFIQIIGNQTTPANCILLFNSSGNNNCGFLANLGFNIGFIDGFSISGNGSSASTPGVWVSQSYGGGIEARYGSTIHVGANVRVNYFYYGISSRYGADILCDPGVSVSNSGDCGYHAFAASLDAQGCTAYTSSDTGAGLGFGFCAESAGFINAQGSSTANNHASGFYANDGGAMWAMNTSSNGNGADGYLAQYGGNIDVSKPPGGSGGNSYSNTGNGYNANFSGTINANSALANLNGANGFISQKGSTMDITAASATNNTGNGYYAEGNSHFEGSPINAYNNTGFGMLCANGSSSSFASGVVNSNKSGGLKAAQSSTIFAPSVTVLASIGHGVSAFDCSSIYCDNAISNSATSSGNGFYASANSTIRGVNMSANNNAGWGFYSENLAYMTATSGGGVTNTLGFRSPTTNGTAANNGSYITM